MRRNIVPDDLHHISLKQPINLIINLNTVSSIDPLSCESKCRSISISSVIWFQGSICEYAALGSVWRWKLIRRDEGVRDIRKGVEKGFGCEGVMFRNSSWLDNDSDLHGLQRNRLLLDLLNDVMDWRDILQVWY